MRNEKTHTRLSPRAPFLFAPGDLAAVPYLLRLDKAANGGVQKKRAFHPIRSDYSYLDESALRGVRMCVEALGALGEATADKLVLKGLCQSKKFSAGPESRLSRPGRQQ